MILPGLIHDVGAYPSSPIIIAGSDFTSVGGDWAYYLTDQITLSPGDLEGWATWHCDIGPGPPQTYYLEVGAFFTEDTSIGSWMSLQNVVNMSWVPVLGLSNETRGYYGYAGTEVDPALYVRTDGGIDFKITTPGSACAHIDRLRVAWSYDRFGPSAPNAYVSDPAVGNWSTDRTIHVSWSGAVDDMNEVKGYSILWNNEPYTIPDPILDTYVNWTTTTEMPDGRWYLHIMSIDTFGNSIPSAFHVGPYLVGEGGFGWLRVTTIPNVPTMISLDGHWASRWGIDWMRLTPGNHTLTFSDIFGKNNPGPITVNIQDGRALDYTAVFAGMCSLTVRTSPALPSTIYVNGIARSEWGLSSYVPPGTYTISFGPVSGWSLTSPAQQTVTVVFGLTTEVVGEFRVDPKSEGPDPATYGLLRVTTNPAAQTMIKLNGEWTSYWGIDWLKLAPGTYTLSFTDVMNAIAPAPQIITITSGETTTIDASFAPRGALRVITNPAVPSIIYVDGLPRNSWGIWTDVAPGTHTVSFGTIGPSWSAPPEQIVTVEPAGYTEVIGTFTTV